jgi:hypothetical protein
MLAGHVGAALAVARTERRINLGAFVFAALLLDVLLWTFILLGWESVTIPGDFAATRRPAFVFPNSHSLVAGVAWSALAGVAACIGYARRKAARWRPAALFAVAVFSHWLLDALVHVPGLPLAGAGSPEVGLGLWQNLPVAHSVEAAVVVAGLCLFVPGAAMPRRQKMRLTLLSILVLAFTVAGQTWAPPPPSAAAMAGSSLVTILVVCVLAYRFGRS